MCAGAPFFMPQLTDTPRDGRTDRYLGKTGRRSMHGSGLMHMHGY